MKRAILNVADTGPLESLVVMLRSVGYECYLPDNKVKDGIRAVGCDLVLNIADLVKGMGYEPPFVMPVATLADMGQADLFVDVKAHRNYSKIVGAFPNLIGKVLWYRINGGQPEHVIKRRGTPQEEDCGDERNPPCPILTPNLWYRDDVEALPLSEQPILDMDPASVGTFPKVRYSSPTPWAGRAYSCYPPFYRFDEYYPINQRVPSTDPICLIQTYVDGVTEH